MINRLAIVPARGGSKRIQGKNIRLFCSQPMIKYVLCTIRESQLFSKIHVSTESNEIREVVTSLGMKPDFPRPKELADDLTPIMPVLRYVTEEYQRCNMHFDEIWLLMACNPLLHASTLAEAAEAYSSTDRKKPLLAVSEYPVPIEWAFSMGKNKSLMPVQSEMFSKRSQDINKCYYDSGSFSIFPPSSILKSEGAGRYDNFLGFILPKGTAIDIDDEDDWRLAERLYLSMNHDKLA